MLKLKLFLLSGEGLRKTDYILRDMDLWVEEHVPVRANSCGKTVLYVLFMYGDFLAAANKIIHVEFHCWTLHLWKFNRPPESTYSSLTCFTWCSLFKWYFSSESILLLKSFTRSKHHHRNISDKSLIFLHFRLMQVSWCYVEWTVTRKLAVIVSMTLERLHCTK